jgi:hypothetical protein
VIGNPHNWDRIRRCDHSDYDPVCGPCEGIGGIPFGDDNDQIKLTSCKPIAGKDEVNPNTLVRPVWGRAFTTYSWEVLIGKKTDPFCFQAFPGNSSEGSLCYRPQTGRQVYDFEKSRALREDIEVKTPVGNVTSTVLHQGKNFWIVNKLPWYAAGIHQCICTMAKEGFTAQTGVYPLQTNWTDNLIFVARENIGVEYDQGTHILDHWAFGPHHVWSFPENGTILRMWQPFNGLQIFPTGANPGPVDANLFSEIPPAMCKKGGATIRVKCTDDGYPMVPTNDDHAGNVADHHPADIIRAVTKVPRDQYKGKSFPHMSETLNGFLNSNKLIETRPCSEWTAREIQDLQGKLFQFRSTDFDDIYHEVKDRRRLSKSRNLEEISAEWEELNSAVEGSEWGEKAHEILRDGHCHEAVMWYVHHLSQDIKNALGQGESKVVLPLLSESDHHNQDSGSCSEARKYLDPTGAIAMACEANQDKVSCASCHSDSPYSP